MKTLNLAAKRGNNRCLNNMLSSSTQAFDMDEDHFRKTNIYVPMVITDIANKYSLITVYKLHPLTHIINPQ